MKKVICYSLILAFCITTNLYAQEDLDRPVNAPKDLVRPVNVPKDTESYEKKQYNIFGIEKRASQEKNKLNPNSVDVDHAKAIIARTHAGSVLKGEVTFSETKDGINVKAVVSGVPPGEHGFHIHEYGNCLEEGKAAGGHYNPLRVEHGNVMKDGQQKAHMGDMGNITVDENGKGILQVFLPGASLTGKYGILGKSVILHQNKDDFSQPTGNAGSRIGCGIITK